MNDKSRILFLYDSRHRTRAALRTAAELARKTGRHLTAAEVVEDAEQIVELIRSDRRQNLERYVDTARARGVEVVTEELTGDPLSAILAAVTSGSYKLIVKSPDTTLDASLLRHSPIPVWVVEPPTVGASRVLAAIEPFGAKADGPLNRMVLERAAEMAEMWGAELHVASSWAPGGLASLAGTRRLTAFEEEARRGQIEQLDALPELSIPANRLHLIGGSPAQAIAELARGEKIDLIVAGTAARDGLAGVLKGNTAERLLKRAACSLLVIPGLDDGTPQAEASAA